MPGLYDIAKAVYSGDVHAARGVLETMRRDNWDVLRARLASGLPQADPVPVAEETQASLDKVMAPLEAEMYRRPKTSSYRRP